MLLQIWIFWKNKVYCNGNWTEWSAIWSEIIRSCDFKIRQARTTLGSLRKDDGDGRLDYQPLFGKMSPHSSPRRSSSGRIKTGPGRRRKSSLRRRPRERQKCSRFRQAKQQLCTCITLSCTFLCRRCTTTTWNGLSWHFVEDGKKRQLSFFFFWTLMQSFRIQFKKKLPTFDELIESE